MGLSDPVDRLLHKVNPQEDFHLPNQVGSHGLTQCLCRYMYMLFQHMVSQFQSSGYKESFSYFSLGWLKDTCHILGYHHQIKVYGSAKGS